MTRPRFAATLVAASAVLVLTLTACTPDKTQVSPPEEGAAPPANGESPAPNSPAVPVDDVYDQTLVWEECGDLECTYIQVPVDWSDPEGDTTFLSLNRHKATNSGARIGSLLINPGGPGGSGLTFTQPLTQIAGDDLLESYDIVGFDPRGVGASTPVECGTGEQIDAFYLPDTVIETQEQLDAAAQDVDAFARNCRVESGDIAENVDTVSAARDMDVIRAAVGDEQLHFLGFSYGTQLGATYAQIYPENVGRMVLDGGVDFLMPSEDMSAGQAEGFENAFTNFLRWCSAGDDCPLSGSIESQQAQVSRLMEQARNEPLPTGTDWSLNGNLFVYGVVVTLYDEGSWPLLKAAFEEIIEQDTAAIMYELANFYLSRDGVTGEYGDNSTWAFTAIRCLDSEPSDNASTIEEVRDYAAQMQQASPTFGWWFGSGAGCEGWPWSATEHVTDLDEAAAAGDQLLVVGTTQDPATPLQWSVSLAERLDATMLTYDGEGHTAYGRSNQCVIDAVDGFLVDGEMPAADTQC